MNSQVEKIDQALEMLPLEARPFATPNCHVRKYRHGQCIAPAHTLLEGPMYLLKGAVSISHRQPDGHDAVICFARQQRWHMGLQVATHTKTIYDSYAVGEVEMIVWPRMSYLLAFKHCEELRHVMTQHCLDAMECMMRQLEHSVTLTLQQRLARRLLELADKVGVPLNEQSIRINAPISHAFLASSLGVTRQRIHSQLRDWAKLGLLDSSYRDVVLHQPQALRQMAA